jgi:hypothetical protein
MKKRRRPRPKYKKARPAPIAKPQNEMHSSTIGTGQTSSTIGTSQLGAFRTSNPSVEHPPRQLVEPKIELSARGMSKARSWGIFAVMIISWLLLAGVVVLFATLWT